MTTPVDQRVCVIGAGSSGLAAARHFVQRGFETQLLDREPDLGGNWNITNAHARVYDSTRMISSKRFTQYPDHPMPRDFPDYPHHAQVLDYLRSYAQRFDLLRRTLYQTSVTRIEPVDAGQAWDITYRRGPEPHASSHTQRYGWVVIANGHNWSPRWPDIPGAFAGQLLHSASYKSPDVLRGRRVLILGAGNTGCDLAVEAAHHARFAAISMRRGYHFIPKYFMGRPADRLGDSLAEFGLPLALRRALITLGLRLFVGSPHRFGLPRPDHRLFETHPIINSLLPYYVRHQAIACRPDVRAFEGELVRFADGRAEPYDLVICATGYRVDIPFIDPSQLNWRDDAPHLHLNVFHPTHDRLFVGGLIQPDSGQFGLVHWQGLVMARFAELVRAGDPRAERLRRAKAPLAHDDAQPPRRYAASPRHRLEVEHISYLKSLQKLARQLGA